MEEDVEYRAVVIGASTGGIDALREIVSLLSDDSKIPLLVVQHTSPYSENYLVKILDEVSKLKVKEAEEKELIEKGKVYIAPPNYHMLIEKNESISFESGEKVCYSRPSIDVLFETAAEVYREGLVAIILTGANNDGANGLNYVKKCGGTTIVQSPEEAEIEIMPLAAMKKTEVDYILSLKSISDFINKINFRIKATKK